MVIILIGILGSVAVPQFLDFRKEAKVAAVRQGLGTLRVALKNHLQQAILRCGASLPPWTPATTTWNIYTMLYYSVMLNNDITSLVNGPTNRPCTPEQVPNPEDRKFLDIPQPQRATYYQAGAPLFTPPIPINPFVTLNYDFVYPMRLTSTFEVNGEGGQCSLVDADIAGGSIAHWYLNEDTGEIFPGTNTPDVAECNF